MKQFFILLLAFIFLSCSSGHDVKGKVTDRSQSVVAGVVVRLITIADDGTELAEIDQSVTTNSGKFTFDFPGTVGSSLLVEALLPNGTFRAFAAGDGDRSDVGPVSEALVQAILQVTATKDGKSLSDFSVEEIRGIAQALNEADFSGIDLADGSALLSAVILEAGRLIPDAAGGEVTVAASASLEPPDVSVDAPALGPSATCGRDALFVDGEQFQFDLTESGTTCRVIGLGTNTLSNAFNIAFDLSLVGDTFVDSGLQFFPGDLLAGDPARKIEDDREYLFGPVLTTAGLRVTRKVYIPETGDLLRYLEIFENPTSAEVTLSVELRGELGIGIGNEDPAVLADSNDNRIANEEDDWAAFFPSVPAYKIPTIGILWNTEKTLHAVDEALLPDQNGNAFLLRWDDVTIPAGETKTIATFAKVMTSVVPATAREELESIFFSPDFSGMNSNELASLENLQSTRGNILGEAGSVVSDSTVTATNGRTSETASTTAGKDGSFALLISGTSGDSIQISATDGYSETSTVP